MRRGAQGAAAVGRGTPRSACSQPSMRITSFFFADKLEIFEYFLQSKKNVSKRLEEGGPSKSCTPEKIMEMPMPMRCFYFRHLATRFASGWLIL